MTKGRLLLRQPDHVVPTVYFPLGGALAPYRSDGAAFRHKVWMNRETGNAEWGGGFSAVLDLWVSTAPELAQQTKAAVKD